MAIPISNVTRRAVYAPSGTGGIGPYAFTFEILANTDIAVYKDDVLLTLTTHYTVTINANGTGSVTITATGLALAPTSPTQYAIVGNRTIARATDFTTGGDFFANTLNDELDQQTIFNQQNAEGLGRALQAPQTDPTTINMTLPRASLRANKALGFDANGNPAIADTLGTNRGNWSASVLYYVRDIVKDTTNNNIWQCIVQHTSSGSQPINTNTDAAKWTLLVDAASATTSATNAANSATAAAASASAASTSATNAASSASAASTSATNAASSASTASAAASSVSAGVTLSSQWATLTTGIVDSTDYSSKAWAVGGTGVTDTSSRGAAKEWAVKTSGTVDGTDYSAKYYALQTVSSASAAASSASAASSSASAASTSASNASSSASSASTSASNASTSATNASTSASTATTQATNAASSASAAATSASNAATSASNAASSASTASTAATNAAASYDAFDDRYLGSKSTAPSVDNDGNALLTGALYWNTTANQLYVWTGSAWDAAAFSVSGAVTSFNTRTGSVTLTSTDVTSALGFTPATAASVSAIPDPVAMALVFGS